MFGEGKVRVVFGKIHISPWMDSTVEDRIWELINSGHKHLQQKYRGAGRYYWVFGDPIKKTIDNDVIVFARLGKISTEKIETEYDEKSKSFIPIERHRATTVMYSNFILHPESKTIVFEDRWPEISVSAFRRNFSAIYLELFPDLTQLQIVFVVEVGQVFEIIKKYDRVISAQFDNLSPSNPDFSKKFKRLDGILKEANARRGNLKLRNEEGLNVEKSVISEAIHLCGTGRGEYKIVAEKGDEVKEIRSRDQIKRRWIKIVDEPEDIIRKFHKLLKKKK